MKHRHVAKKNDIANERVFFCVSGQPCIGILVKPHQDTAQYSGEIEHCCSDFVDLIGRACLRLLFFFAR